MPGKHYTKKGRGFRMMGMDFGNKPAPEENLSNPLMKAEDSKLSQLTQKAEWDKGPNEKGYITKSKSGINLFGRERNVTKYYDPETGAKVGKQVTVARGKGDPRPDKVKIKKVNPGLTQSGGVGKIRMDKNPWDTGAAKKTETDINRAQRGAEIKDKNVTYNEKGNPELPDYAKAYKGFKEKDGKKINPRTGAEYSKLSEFEDDAEAWWDEQARETGNKKLEEQNQEYGLDEKGNVKFSQSPNKYGRTKSFAKKSKPYKMKKYRK